MIGVTSAGDRKRVSKGPQRKLYVRIYIHAHGHTLPAMLTQIIECDLQLGGAVRSRRDCDVAPSRNAWQLAICMLGSSGCAGMQRTASRIQGREFAHDSHTVNVHKQHMNAAERTNFAYRDVAVAEQDPRKMG